jgi:hypothetical protein
MEKVGGCYAWAEGEECESMEGELKMRQNHVLTTITCEDAAIEFFG